MVTRLKTGSQWDEQAPAWHTVGHVWSAASHGCLAGVPTSTRFTDRGPDVALGEMAALCPHAEFRYAGAVCQAIGATLFLADRDEEPADWADWPARLHDAVRSGERTCVFGGDPSAGVALSEPSVGDQLRDRMRVPSHLRGIRATAEALRRDGSAEVGQVLSTLAS